MVSDQTLYKFVEYTSGVNHAKSCFKIELIYMYMIYHQLQCDF